MKILGIVGSARKLGNTEILVKEALKAAQEEKATVSIIRLTDLHIEPCDGCMACVIERGTGCPKKDDVRFLVELLKDSDGLILGAPSYLGRPPGTWAMIEDRLCFWGLNYLEPLANKKAVVIGVAGGATIAWWLVPHLNYFAHLAGFEPIASFLAASQGPGEVLLPERHDIIKEVNRIARDLVFALRGETEHLSDGVHRLRGWDWECYGYGQEGIFTTQNCCPYCFSQAVTILHGDYPEQDPKLVRCAICRMTVGKIFVEKNKYAIRLERKTEEEIRQWHAKHMKEIVEASVPLYRRRRTEIKELRARYKDLMPWILPSQEEK